MKNIREAWNYNTKLGTDSVQLPYKVKVNNSSKLTFSVEKHYVLCFFLKGQQYQQNECSRI